MRVWRLRDLTVRTDSEALLLDALKGPSKEVGTAPAGQKIKLVFQSCQHRHHSCRLR